jgi:HEAT repeat protein
MRAGAGIALLLVALSTPASGQVSVTQPGFHPPRPERLPPVAPPPPAPSTTERLRQHFGVDLASRLLRSTDAEERLRGIARLASIGSPEAVSMLVHAARDPAGSHDTRALLAIVRGLADRTATSEVRQLFKDGLLGSISLRSAASSPETDAEGEGRDARLALVRAAAALALATSPDPHAVEALVLVARETGPGQAAAIDALTAFPPETVATAITGPLTPALLRLSAKIGDLRALDAVHAALQATDAATRAAALDAMVAMEDSAAGAAAGRMLKDAEPRVREAAAHALVRLGVPERFRAVDALVGDDATAREGLRLAGLAADGGVIKTLAALAVVSADPEMRALAVFGLGRCEDPLALQALAALARDPLRGGDAAAALARSPAPGAAAAIEALAGHAPRLGARAYIVRALTLGGDEAWGTTVLEALATSRDPADRTVGLAGLVLLGRRDALDAVRDPDAGVRRAVAMAAMGDPRESTRRAMLRVSTSETDDLARRVERAALAGGDPEAVVGETELAASVAGGKADAALAAMTLAAEAWGSGEDSHRVEGSSVRETVDALLASTDPILRAHAARGLAASPDPSATGRLARAYDGEVDPLVRHAIVQGLARRTADADSPTRLATLRIAARLDPDETVRVAAARAQKGLPPESRRPLRFDVAWLRLATRAGEAPEERDLGGALLRSDGLAVPVAFDADGYALVPIVPGEARLLLAPRIPAYDVPSR